MSRQHRDPVHVTLVMSQSGPRVVVNGVDLSQHVRAFRVEAGEGALTDVWLDLIGVAVDIDAEVPRSRIQALTPEQDDVREQARTQRDTVRGQRTYPRQTPSILLAASLGEVKP
jgi:hypothetical protein